MPEMSLILDLVCVQCGASYREGAVNTCPTCGPDEGILDVRFDLKRAAATLNRTNLGRRPQSHWRYRELLPLDDAYCPVGPASLPAAAGTEARPTEAPPTGALGWTPLIEAPRLAKVLGIGRLRLKD